MYEETKTLPEDFVNFLVSEGTLRSEDIADAIQTFVNNNKDVFEFDGKIQDLIDEFMECDETDEACNEIFTELWDEMDNVAPEGCVFGGHIGDSALIGFWYEEECYE